jgi:hypothetical protein
MSMSMSMKVYNLPSNYSNSTLNIRSTGCMPQNDERDDSLLHNHVIYVKMLIVKVYILDFIRCIYLDYKK